MRTKRFKRCSCFVFFLFCVVVLKSYIIFFHYVQVGDCFFFPLIYIDPELRGSATERNRERENTQRETERQTDIQSDKTGRQTDIQTHCHTDRQAGRLSFLITIARF